MSDDRSLFGKLQPPNAPEALRQRVLTTARDAAATLQDRGVWDVLWESRAVRLWWMASVAALLGAHGLLLLAPPAERGRTAERREARRAVGMSELNASMQALRNLEAEALASDDEGRS
jgi:hypothetical protein